MRKLLSYTSSLALLFFLLLTSGQAQDDKALLAELVAADEEAVNALVLYPEETRMAILEVSLYPEALIKLEHIQSQTKTRFQELLAQYPQATQEVIWDLTRYPNLIAKLAAAIPENSKDWKQLLADYPEVIHQRAKEAYLNHWDELKVIDALDTEARLAFDDLLVTYSTSTQESLRHLLPLPEVLSILTENIRLTVLVGALYRREPDWLLTQVDSLNLVVARQNAQELEDWKASLEEDPTAMKELTSSAESFRAEYNYDDDYYDYTTQDDLYYQDRAEDRVMHDYYFYHFPYWFGYPEWYYYPRWRLYPSWYDWGFYWGANRTVVVIGLPSFYFTHWYFYSPRHHYRWSHLSAHFARHYDAHPRNGSSITTGVRVWQHQNREVVSREWLRDDGGLSNRFREYGKFEADRVKYNRTHPQKQVTQRQYIESNSRRYPTIAKEATRRKATNPTIVRPPKGEKTKPRVPLQTNPRKIETPKRTSKVRPPKQKTTVRKVPRKVPPIKQGNERHRSLSERMKRTRTPKVQSRKPKVQTPKTRTIKPKPTTKKVKPRKGNG